MRTRRLLAAAVGAALAALVTGCSSSPAASSSSSTAISFTDASCGGAWHLARPGWHTFEITNDADYGAEVDLTNPASGAVYDELQNMGPGTTAAMSLDVGSGRYAFLCEVQDFDPVTGPTVTVGGHAAGTPAIVPVSYDDLYPLAKEYAKYTEAGLRVLARQTTTLAADVRGGRLAAAKRDWLTAHLQYETLGAAYDAFGNFDDEIDGRADAVGVSSPKWTGFYRLEYGLWHGQSVPELTAVADTLNTNVHQLLAWWPGQEIPLVDIDADPGAAANLAALQGRLPAVPFHGRHQAGILPEPKTATAVISFDATAQSRAELAELFQTVTDRARFLTAGGMPPPAGIGGPSSDSGTLGPTVLPDGLTVTFGVGSTLFDDRYGLASRRPAHLTPMSSFPNDDLDPAQCGGDLILQLSAGNEDVALHALRDIAKNTRGVGAARSGSGSSSRSARR